MNTEQLLAQLREASGYLWPEMVRYTFVNSLIGIAGYSLSLIVLAILTYKFDMLMHKGYLSGLAKDERTPKFDYYAPAFAVTVVVLFASFFMLAELANSVSVAIAPEGATVMKLVRGIK